MKTNCCVYIACKMTRRDRVKMIDRARYVCAEGKKRGLTIISPVIEERVPYIKGPLVNKSRSRLKIKWKEDKNVIMSKAHVCLFDQAHDKSFGMEREYGMNRWCYWKPTVLVMKNCGITIADFEDDAVFDKVEEALDFIKNNYGTWYKRFRWRLRMLNRCLPHWLWGQLLAWR